MCTENEINAEAPRSQSMGGANPVPQRTRATVRRVFVGAICFLLVFFLGGGGGAKGKPAKGGGVCEYVSQSETQI